jgi:transposase-like protein
LYWTNLRGLPSGKDTWVWQGQNVQNEMNHKFKLNLKLLSAFSGKDRRKWKLFLAECAIYFQAKSKTYSDDVAKITFAASLLEDAELNLKLLSAFSGKDRRKWKLFLAECAIYFQAKSKTYSDDVAKITFAASLLEDAALKHYTIMLQQQSNSKFFKEWPIFIANMGDMFGVPNQQHKLQRILSHL